MWCADSGRMGKAKWANSPRGAGAPVPTFPPRIMMIAAGDRVQRATEYRRDGERGSL
jgi:hypothetical protein